MKIARILLALGVAAPASPAAAEPRAARVQLLLSGGTSIFRGGRPASPLSSAVPFQPDTTAPPVAGGFSVRLLRHLAADLELAYAWGREEEGERTPDNFFLSGGLRVPWAIADGRLVPYLSLGGGVVERRPSDDFQRAVERAFELRETDPQAYGGGGLQWRATSLVGVHADYRYLRIFPEDVGDLGIERRAYGCHRVTGGVSLSF